MRWNTVRWYDCFSLRQYVLASAGVIAAAAIALLQMGQVPICTCGYLKPWHGIVLSAENSQHLSDWD